MGHKVLSAGKEGRGGSLPLMRVGVESPVVHNMPRFPGMGGGQRPGGQRPGGANVPARPMTPNVTFNVVAPQASEVFFTSDFTEGKLPLNPNSDGSQSILTVSGN